MISFCMAGEKKHVCSSGVEQIGVKILNDIMK